MKRKLGALLSALLIVTATSISAFAETTDKAGTEYEVGSTLEFGTYEQDNNPDNGAEPIEWTVLDVQDGKALIISKYALDTKPYNEEFTDVTWETCTLRKWLGEDFLDTAFTADEQKRIETAKLTNEDNSYEEDFRKKYDYPLITKGGNDTEDKVFLLSISEVIQYFKNVYWEDLGTFGCSDDLLVEPTEYAKANGADLMNDESYCFWWLRSPGYGYPGDPTNSWAGHVDAYGIVGPGAPVSVSNVCVRPALWINLEA